MRVTVPSRQHGARNATLAFAALVLLGAGALWLLLRAFVALVTLD
jgi:hypothetical protein